MCPSFLLVVDLLEDVPVVDRLAWEDHQEEDHLEWEDPQEDAPVVGRLEVVDLQQE